MKVGIPQKIHMIWIGPKDPPLQWMNTWPEKHPDWEYVLWDNKRMAASEFYNQHLIDEYMHRREYAGVADLMRYEILYKFGGFMPGADAICLQAIDELFPEPMAYTVYENEVKAPGSVSPIHACQAGNEFVQQIVQRLHKLEPKDLKKPWQSVGNQFLGAFIKEMQPEITIFPSHYFIPVHYTGHRYNGNGKIYAKQMWGSTKMLYTTNGERPKDVIRITVNPMIDT